MGFLLKVKSFQNIVTYQKLNAFTPRVSYGDINMILTSESVDEILWCDHSNETSSAVLSPGTIYILVFYKMKFGIRLEF